MTAPYTMTIETEDGAVKPHGFHLGTILGVAHGFALEALRRPGVRTVALHGPAGTRVYDFRDLAQADGDDMEGEDF